MSDKRNIEDKIRESFEGMNRKAPKDIWENLNEKLVNEDALNKKVKESFEDSEVSAPKQVWEGINKQLNIDSAWKGVKRMLIWRTIVRRSRRFAALILLLLFFGWGGSQFFKQYPERFTLSEVKTEKLINQKDNQEQKHTPTTIKESAKLQKGKGENSNQNNPQQPESKISTEEFVGTAPSTDKNAVKGEEFASAALTVENAVTKSNLFQNRNTMLLIDEKETAKKANEQELAVLQQIPMLPAKMIMDSSTNLQILEIACLEDSVFKEKNRKRFEVGLIYSYNQTTLFNNETRKSFDEQSLVSSEASYAGNFGISGLFRFSQRHGITANGYMKSGMKQHYKTYLEGQYTEKDIRLDYRKLAVAYQHNIMSNIPLMETSFTVNGGVYYAWLKKGTSSYNGVINTVTDNFANNDFGILVQAGQEVTKGSFVLSYGFNLERGLKNIFAGDGKTPADFDVTTAFSIGGYLSTRYKF